MNTIPYKTTITVDEALQNIEDNEGKCLKFLVKKNWSSANYSSLYNEVDDTVAGGEFLEEIDYTPLNVEGNDIMFEVIVNDVSEYLKEYK